MKITGKSPSWYFDLPAPVVIARSGGILAWEGALADGAHYQLACQSKRWIDTMVLGGHQFLMLGLEITPLIWTEICKPEDPVFGAIWRAVEGPGNVELGDTTSGAEREIQAPVYFLDGTPECFMFSAASAGFQVSNAAEKFLKFTLPRGEILIRTREVYLKSTRYIVHFFELGKGDVSCNIP